MRKLKHVILMRESPDDILALDENGELWFGELISSEDGRRVVNWSPVQLPPDGMAFSEPQLSFWDRMEKKARANYEANPDRRRETSIVAETK